MLIPKVTVRRHLVYRCEVQTIAQREECSFSSLFPSRHVLRLYVILPETHNIPQRIGIGARYAWPLWVCVVSNTDHLIPVLSAPITPCEGNVVILKETWIQSHPSALHLFQLCGLTSEVDAERPRFNPLYNAPIICACECVNSFQQEPSELNCPRSKEFHLFRPGLMHANHLQKKSKSWVDS